MKRVLLLAVLVAAPGLVFAETEIATFGLMMNSSNVPSVIGDRSIGGGDISIRIDRDDGGTATRAYVTFRLNWQFEGEQNVTAAHIHRGGPGMSGPVVVGTGLMGPLMTNPQGAGNFIKWGIHLTQVAPRRCGLVDPWTPAHCTQNAPWGARRRSAGNWATRLRFGPIKDYARAMAIAGLETWCYRQAFPGAANGQPQYVVVT